MLENFDPQLIQDVESARKAVILLLNLVEDTSYPTFLGRYDNRPYHLGRR